MSETPGTYGTCTPIVSDDSPAIPRRSSSEPLLSAVLPIKLSNGNRGRTKTWFSAAKERNDFEATILSLGLKRQPFSCRVWVRVTRILGPKQAFWDADSYQRGNLKELIDALKACGWWVDDGWKYIAEVRFDQDATQRKNGPAVKVEVFTAGP